jgi:AhpD family alkylhydroperoxidase
MMRAFFVAFTVDAAAVTRDSPDPVTETEDGRFVMNATNGRVTDHEHHANVLNELNPQHRALRQMIPDVYRGFGELSRAALATGALDTKVKELIAMAIGVVHGCDGCIASHAGGAARAGATKQEAAEVIGVSIMMHGGPATIYGARAYTAFCEFADSTVSQST